MQIEHVAIWTTDLERLKFFYENYFGATSGDKYVNETKGFSSYFLSFAAGPRLELMQRTDVTERSDNEQLGYAHLAVVVGDESAVDELAKRFAADGYPAIDGPRHTGDGYYECVVLDPDGNGIEICAHT